MNQQQLAKWFCDIETEAMFGTQPMVPTAFGDIDRNGVKASYAEYMHTRFEYAEMPGRFFTAIVYKGIVVAMIEYDNGTFVLH